MKEIHILNLGVMNYSAVFDLMKELQRKRIDGEISDKLIFVEHEEVVTLGPKAKKKRPQGATILRSKRIGEEGYLAWARWLCTRSSSGKGTCRTLER